MPNQMNNGFNPFAQNMGMQPMNMQQNMGMNQMMAPSSNNPFAMNVPVAQPTFNQPSNNPFGNNGFAVNSNPVQSNPRSNNDLLSIQQDPFASLAASSTNKPSNGFDLGMQSNNMNPFGMPNAMNNNQPQMMSIAPLQATKPAIPQQMNQAPVSNPFQAQNGGNFNLLDTNYSAPKPVSNPMNTLGFVSSQMSNAQSLMSNMQSLQPEPAPMNLAFNSQPLAAIRANQPVQSQQVKNNMAGMTFASDGLGLYSRSDPFAHLNPFNNIPKPQPQAVSEVKAPSLGSLLASQPAQQMQPMNTMGMMNGGFGAPQQFQGPQMNNANPFGMQQMNNNFRPMNQPNNNNPFAF